MNAFVFASPLQTTVLDPTVVVAVLVLLSGGLVGMSIRNMFESIMSEEEAEGGDNSFADDDLGDDLGGGLMDEHEEDDLGGLGGLDDDLGGFDDDLDDDLGGAGGGNAGELEHRLDELENEMGSLSSTVNTVRTENEQISESVSEVEENVRKLLDIYEMVTRGVNPFADDIDAGMGGGMSDGSFGLFADEGGDDGDGDVDGDIAEADAEGFFDEDLVGSEDDLFADGDEFAGGEDESGAAFQDSFDEEFGTNGFDDEDESGGGASFEDLKAEYESGEADWAEDEGEDSFADDELFDEVVDEEGDDQDDQTGDDREANADALGGDDPAEQADEATDGTVEGDVDTASGAAGAVVETAEAETAEAETAEAETAAAGATTGAGGATKPYLSTVPEGFAAELVVVEWLEFLVDEAGVRGAARALEYYAEIDWIAEDVAGELQSYLRGFDGSGDESLSIDHHTQSLKYVGQLNGDVAAVASGLGQGGGADGVQR